MNMRQALRDFAARNSLPSTSWVRRIAAMGNQDPDGEGAVPLAILSQGIVDAKGNVFTNRQTTVTGTTYTITAADCGAWIQFTSGSAVTVTVSANLPAQFGCACAQEGAGTITFQAASGATIQGASLTSSGQYTQNVLYVVSNSNGASAAVRVY